LKPVEVNILGFISRDKAITYDELALNLKVHRDTVRVYMNSLKKSGVVKRIGSDKTGHWEILKH
jgi:predicted HTH transcriptional regulator